MACPVHKAGDGPDANDARPVEEEGVIQRFLSEFADAIRPYFESLTEALEAGAIDPAAGSLAVDLRDRFDPYRESFQVVFRQGHADGYETGREAAIRQQDLDISFDLVRDEVIDRVRENAERAAEEVELTIVGDLAGALTEAQEEGYGIPETTELLRDEVFGPATEGYQAERAARTEVISSSNHGAYDAYRDSAASTKTWQATDDSRTRRTHNAADQQTVPMDEPFSVGGFEAQFPGDPSLPPQERVNCRCTLLPTGFDS